MDYMFLWEKGYKSNTINNLSFKELNSGVRDIERNTISCHGESKDMFLTFSTLIM